MLLFFIFRFEYFISGQKSYWDFRQTGPRSYSLRTAEVFPVVASLLPAGETKAEKTGYSRSLQVLQKFHYRRYFQQSKTIFSVVVFFRDNIGGDEKLRHLRSFSRTSFSFHKVFDWQLFNFYDSFFNWPLSDSTSHHTVKLCPYVQHVPMWTKCLCKLDFHWQLISWELCKKGYNLKIINEWGWASYFTINEWG